MHNTAVKILDMAMDHRGANAFGSTVRATRGGVADKRENYLSVFRANNRRAYIEQQYRLCVR